MEPAKPEIKRFPQTHLAGKCLTMSFSSDRTPELWRSFMPERKRIADPAGPDLYSVEVYASLDFFKQFNPQQTFEKWACVPVKATAAIPASMQLLVIPEGDYAVFRYRAAWAPAPEFYRRIYAEWLPASTFVLDDRPHFARMGPDYNREDPESEETIWIPVRSK